MLLFLAIFLKKCMSVSCILTTITASYAYFVSITLRAVVVIHHRQEHISQNFPIFHNRFQMTQLFQFSQVWATLVKRTVASSQTSSRQTCSTVLSDNLYTIEVTFRLVICTGWVADYFFFFFFCTRRVGCCFVRTFTVQLFVLYVRLHNK